MKKTNLYRIAAALLPLFNCAWGDKPALQNQSDHSQAPQEAVEAWKDLRFGMFIHWGPVALTGHEIGWSRGKETPIEEYDNLYTRFNPVDFDAEQWVRTAKAAGMKYIVLTTKHHDGFCLWPSEHTDYDIAATPFGRDVVGELAAACRKGGIGFGTYYSTCDWHHPDFPRTSPGGKVNREKSNLDAYTAYLKAQTKELLTNYGPLLTLWYDVPQEFDVTRGQGVIDMARAIQPDIVINNRTGARGDYDTPEQKIGSFQIDRPWETCMTIARQWAWKPNDRVKSLEECLRGLIATIGGDGNFLFNVGPDAAGIIEPEQVQRLEEMGRWIAKYAEGIYATRGGPFKPAGWGASTHKGNVIYLFIFHWPANGNLIIPMGGKKILKAENLSGKTVELKESEGGCTLSVPSGNRDPVATVIKLVLATPTASIAPMEMPSISGSLAFGKPARSSSSQWNTNPEHAFDDNRYTGWIAAKGGEQWLETDLEKPQTIDLAIIQSDSAGITLSLQALQEGKWNTVFTVEKTPPVIEKEFPPVTAQTFRILTGNGIPNIGEFQLLNTMEPE